MEPFHWQNVIQGEGLSITITGMAIVFFGLTFISFFIAALPRVLKQLDQMTAKRVAHHDRKPVETREPKKENQEELIASVIATVIHAELERTSFGDQSRITISRGNDDHLFWTSTGKMRKLPNRSSHA